MSVLIFVFCVFVVTKTANYGTLSPHFHLLTPHLSPHFHLLSFLILNLLLGSVEHGNILVLLEEAC